MPKRPGLFCWPGVRDLGGTPRADEGKPIKMETKMTTTKTAKKANGSKATKKVAKKAAPGANRKSYIELKLTPKDKENPYREGTKSFDAFKKVLASPGKTFAEYVQRGARANTLRDAILNKFVTAK